MLSTTYEEALILAAELHRTQKRKGSEIPYLSHLMSVSALVLENGGTEEEAIAGLLHDAIEDAKDGPAAERVRAEIGDRFGAEVLSIVEACTDADAGEKAVENAQDIEERRKRWRIRKERYIEHLETAPGPVLLVSACDKVHNARAIVRDVQVGGRGFFRRFLGGEDGTLWYYGALAEVLQKRVQDEARIGWLAEELARQVAMMESA